MTTFKYGEHIIVLGKPGAGKTYFIKNAILPVYGRHIIIDTEEREFDSNIWPEVSIDDSIKLINSNQEFKRSIKFPVGERGFAMMEEYSFSLLNTSGNTAIYFDEVTDFCDARKIGDGLLSLYRKGRHNNITLIAGTQRPQLLNKSIYTNSIHKFWFFVDEYDIQNWKAYTPYIEEHIGQIPYRSYKCIYERPDGSLQVLKPVKEYKWVK